MTAVENAQSLVDYANESLSTSYTNLTDIITHELDVPEQPAVTHIPTASLGERTKSLIDYANDICESDHENLTEIVLKELKGQRSYSIEDQEPYLFRKSGGSESIGTRMHDKIVGGTVVWNQFLQNSNVANTTGKHGLEFTKGTDGFSFTLSGTYNYTSGDRNIYIYANNPRITVLASHVYLVTTTSKYFQSYLYGVTWSMARAYTGKTPTGGVCGKPTEGGNINLSLNCGANIQNGTVINETVFMQLLDLTQMFGAEIADYIYSLEQATAGAGVAWFRNLFPKPYYAYDAGSLKHVGDTVVWNQLVNKTTIPTISTHGITFTNNDDGTWTLDGTSDAQAVSAEPEVSNAVNHVFYFSGSYMQMRHGGNTLAINGGTPMIIKNTGAPVTVRFRVSSGNTLTNMVVTPQIIDLTQMFGKTIADYIYSLEQATAGAGVAYFRNLFPDDYYPYDTGSLKDIGGMISHDTVGFNLFDKSTITTGKIYGKNGSELISVNLFHSDFIRVIPSTLYYLKSPRIENVWNVVYFGAEKNALGNAKQVPANADGTTFTTPSDCYYVVINGAEQDSICVNISSSRNGTYEPYHKHSYPLDSSLTLRGIPKLDSSNRLYYDGDTYESDGTVTRKYGIVDLGSLTWTYTAATETRPIQRFNSALSPAPPSELSLNLMCALYNADRNPIYGRSIDKVICTYGGNVYISDSAYSDAAAFKTAMSGVYLVYELATPTTETANTFANPQIVHAEGTEQYVVESVYDVILPVGHDTMYSTSEPTPPTPDIPLNTQLIVFGDIVNGYNIDGSDGSESANAAACCSDFTKIDPSMTFSFVGYEWFDLAFYDSSKTFISGSMQYYYADTFDDVYAHGTLDSSRIPSNAEYVRLSSYPTNPDSSVISLIRTA